MARAKVHHSADAVTVVFKGNIKNPEPSTGVIKFPGGHVEVSRCSDGTYWAHVSVVDGSNIIAGRIDRAGQVQSVATLENYDKVNHIAIRIDNTVPHFDPD